MPILRDRLRPGSADVQRADVSAAAILRCSSAGRLARSRACSAGSISAITTPAPSGRQSEITPHGSTIMLWPGAPAVHVRAALRRRDHVGAGSRSRGRAAASPSAPCRSCAVKAEGTNIRSTGAQRAVQLGEAQVVADRQRRCGRTACRPRPAARPARWCAPRRSAPRPCRSRTVHLVVARDALALVRRRRGRRCAPCPARDARERHRAADDPDAVRARGLGEEVPGSARRRRAPRTATLSASFMPMMQKYSGSATSAAPCAAACATRSAAAARFSATLCVDTICTAATLNSGIALIGRPPRRSSPRRARARSAACPTTRSRGIRARGSARADP